MIPENDVHAIRPHGYLSTGQITCHDIFGREIPCLGSGQDAEFSRGLSWPVPRFETQGETVLDRLTGLIWTKDANLPEFPLTWEEAFDYVTGMSRDETLGYSDWRLPNRRELRSLISHQTKNPSLPDRHSFNNVFLGWYWTSTTASINTAYAWYIHMEGGRMFYGNKKQSCLLWPVRGEGNKTLPATGQTQCYDTDGRVISCSGSGQDGALLSGRAWPATRFEVAGNTVIDHLTNLEWLRTAKLTKAQVTWEEAFAAVGQLNRESEAPGNWRLPNINELESLIDCSMHSPALTAGHPFKNMQDAYWSSTTSFFEPEWAWALYLTKGAVGVGQKKNPHFFVWAVRDLAFIKVNLQYDFSST
jgi:hypothetical protein